MRRLEPLWWGLFSVGGTAAAFLLPIHVFLNNVAAPLGWLSPDSFAYDATARLLANPLVKLYLIAFLAATLFHAFHRIGILPADLMLPIPKGPAAFLSHLAAVALAVAAAVIVSFAP